MLELIFSDDFVKIAKLESQLLIMLIVLWNDNTFIVGCCQKHNGSWLPVTLFCLIKHLPVFSCFSFDRKALERAALLLNMKHGISRLDNIWGVSGGTRPVKQLSKKVSLCYPEQTGIVTNYSLS